MSPEERQVNGWMKMSEEKLVYGIKAVTRMPVVKQLVKQLIRAKLRTDPPKGADEPTRAKSVRPTQVNESEREIREGREVR